MNVKRKGDDYEREIAEHLNRALFGGERQVQRMPLSGGGTSLTGAGQSDLLGTPRLWVECKRTERLAVHEALRQATRGVKGARSPDMPTIITRRSGTATGDSLVVMRLDDWLKLYGAYLGRPGKRPAKPVDPRQIDIEELAPLNGSTPTPP